MNRLFQTKSTQIILSKAQPTFSYIFNIIKSSNYTGSFMYQQIKEFSYGKSKQLAYFVPNKLKKIQKLKKLETKDDATNQYFPRTSLLENSPTKEKAVIQRLSNKNRIYPKQQPHNRENEDTNIISYKDRPLALNDDYSFPDEIKQFENPPFESPIGSKSIDVAIVGPTNSGKSSLINSLVNSNISSVSPKANTTDKIIEGVYTDFNLNTQMLFYDTPGAIRASKNSIYATNIITKAWSIIPKADKVIFVVDAVKRIDRLLKLSISRVFKIDNNIKVRKLADKIKEKDITLEEFLAYNRKLEESRSDEGSNLDDYSHVSTILVLNKIDLVTNKRKLKALQDEIENLGKFDKVFHVSTVTGFGLEELKFYLASEASNRNWTYHPSVSTTQCEIEKMEEIVKQNIYKRVYKEVPYGLAVVLTSWVPMSSGEIKMEFKIECKNDNQRMIILGREGDNIKVVKESCEKDLTALYSKPVKCDLVVKNRKISSLKKLNAKDEVIN